MATQAAKSNTVVCYETAIRSVTTYGDSAVLFQSTPKDNVTVIQK